jgi:hypothetical protein
MSPPGELFEVSLVDSANDLIHLLEDPAGFDQLSVCIGGHGKAVGNLHALWSEFPVHLAERGILPAHQGDIADGEFVEPSDIVRLVSHGLLLVEDWLFSLCVPSL